MKLLPPLFVFVNFGDVGRIGLDWIGDARINSQSGIVWIGWDYIFIISVLATASFKFKYGCWFETITVLAFFTEQMSTLSSKVFLYPAF